MSLVPVESLSYLRITEDAYDLAHIVGGVTGKLSEKRTRQLVLMQWGQQQTNSRWELISKTLLDRYRVHYDTQEF